jgi:hypothetical protein
LLLLPMVGVGMARGRRGLWAANHFCLECWAAPSVLQARQEQGTWR